MREPQRTRAPVPSAVRYAVVAAAVLGGFFTLLVAAAHPVAVSAAVGGVVVGSLAGRARERVESYARGLADTGEEPAEPRAEPA
jgi:membrane associated rhomboid family serine protease